MMVLHMKIRIEVMTLYSTNPGTSLQYRWGWDVESLIPWANTVYGQLFSLPTSSQIHNRTYTLLLMVIPKVQQMNEAMLWLYLEKDDSLPMMALFGPRQPLWSAADWILVSSKVVTTSTCRTISWDVANCILSSASSLNNQLARFRICGEYLLRFQTRCILLLDISWGRLHIFFHLLCQKSSSQSLCWRSDCLGC